MKKSSCCPTFAAVLGGAPFAVVLVGVAVAVVLDGVAVDDVVGADGAVIAGVVMVEADWGTTADVWGGAAWMDAV